MPARLTREQKKARTRSEVLRAAREVVARRGLNAATIDEIAEQAGFSHGAIYSNFASKDELVMALYEEFIQIRAEEISEPASEDDFVGGARRAANRWIELVSDDPEGYVLRLEFALHAYRDERLRARLAAQLAANRKLIGQLLQERAEALGVRTPIGGAELGAIIRALGIGLAIEKLVNPDEIEPYLYADAVSWMLGCAGLE